MILPGLSIISIEKKNKLIKWFLDMLQKRRGLIINLSSVSGRRPVPLLGLYSGTKGFVDLFSRLDKF
jgi:short-subunit dehydrogenase